MAFNPLNLIGGKTMSELGSLIKANKTPKPSNSLKMLPDGTIPGGQATAGASSVPVATDHTHGGGNSSKDARITPRPDPVTFMGKGQVDTFSSLTDPGSVSRDGNVIAAADTAKPLTGQAPVLGTDYDRITPRPEDEATMGSFAGYNELNS